MARKTKSKDDGSEFLCLGCGAHTGELLEYYRLRDDVWREAHPAVKGMLCIGCVEARLKRELTHHDFEWVPLNLIATFRGSDHLRARLDANGMIVHALADMPLGDLAFAIADAIVSEHEKLDAILIKH